MPRSSKENRDSLCAEIESNGIEMAPCSSCRNAKAKSGDLQHRCIVGPRSSRCSECIRKGYTKCDVTVSRAEWEWVRDSRDRLRKDLDRAEEREVELTRQLCEHRVRTLRLRKQLRLAERRTDKAVADELEELEATEREETLYLPEDEPTVFEEEQFCFNDILEMGAGDLASIIDDLDPLLDFPNPSALTSL